MLTAKDLLIDFINFIFFLVIVGFCILYFIAGDNFNVFRLVLESLVPFGVLGAFFLINLKFWRQKARKKEREGNLGIILELNFIDKLKSDLFLFVLPVAVLAIAFAARGRVGAVDISAGGAVFAIAYFWQKWLFSKEK
jgi:hypothetical protein